MADTNEFRECADCSCFAMRRGARAVTQLYDRYLRPSGLKATQFTLLAVLGQAGSMPLTRAAGYLGMERTTLTRNLRPLLAKGYVEVDAGQDRRVRMVRITEAGEDVARRALPLWRQAQKAIANLLPAETLQAVQDLGRLDI